jgi:uncharacterized protein
MASEQERQLNVTGAFALWAGLGLFGAFYGAWLGYGGRRFAVAIAVAMALLAGHTFPEARGVKERIRGLTGRLGRYGGLLAALIPFVLYILYAVGTDSLAWTRLGLAAAYTLAPALLLFTVSGENSAAAVWQDYLAVLLIWIPVELRWLYELFPYPPPLRHILTILLALNTGLVAFLLVRKLDGIGYTVQWKRGFARIVGVNLFILAVIAIPIGLALGFLKFDPSLARLRALPLMAVGILFFTAWPEEFLFRGVLQNLLGRTLRSPWAGLFAASVIFGLSHLNNGGFPNWRYAIMATIAGVFYGRAWMKSGSLFAPALVHALVDVLWHVLFR